MSEMLHLLAERKRKPVDRRRLKPLSVYLFVCLFVYTITQERVEIQLRALKPDSFKFAYGSSF